MAEVIDTLVTDLRYDADTKVLDKADKAMKGLEEQSRATARQTDKLTDSQLKLKAQLQVTIESEQTLKAEKAKLTSEIKKSGKATDEQARSLEMVEIQLAGAARTAQGYRNELAKLGIEQAKLARQSRTIALQQRSISGAVRDRRGSDAKKAADAKKLSDETTTLFGRKSNTGGAVFERPDLSGGGIRQSMGEVGSFAAEGAKLVGSAAVVGTAALGAAVIKTGADFEKLREQIRNLEGDERKATQAFDNITQFAKQTPYQLEEVTAAFIKLRAMGLDASNDSLRSYGDLAATMGKDMNMAIEAVADAVTGEFERLKEFGIKASSQGDKVTFTFKGVATTVGKNAEEIENYIKGIGKMEGVGGAMAGQMNTAYGAISNLQDALAQFLDEIAQAGVLDEFKGLLADIAGIAGGDDKSLAKILADGLVSVLKQVREAVQSIKAEDIKGLFESMRDTMQQVADVLGVLWEAFSKIVDISGGVGPAIENITLGIVALKTAMMGPAGLVVAAGAVGVAIGNMFNAMGASDYLDNLIGSISGLNAELRKLELDQMRRNKLSPEQLEKVNKVRELFGRDPLEQEDIDVKQRDLVRLTKGGSKVLTDVDALTKIASGEVQSDVLTQAEATQALEQALAGDIADNRERAMRRGEEVAAREDTKAKRNKKKGKKGAKTKDLTLAHSIDEQMKKNAREIAQAEAARALRAGRIKPEDLAAFETKAYETRLSNMRSRYQQTGELPAGIGMDVRQIAGLPSINDLAGRVAPPVISITNNRYEVSGNTFTTEVTGQFANSPQQVAEMSMTAFERLLQQLLGRAVPAFVTSEQR
jgi:hypothetical protein